MTRGVTGKSLIDCHDDLLTEIEGFATKSRTAKMWVDAFIKPVMIMMLYVRAERMGDWSIHLQAVQLMLPYFFASWYFHYAR